MSAWFWLWLMQCVFYVGGIVWAVWQSLTIERLERERDALRDEVYGVRRP